MDNQPTLDTDASARKADWLAKIDLVATTWNGIVEQIGPDSKAIIDGTWTLKGIAAHLNGWREWSARRLEAAAAGTGVPVMPWPAGMNEETDAATDEINAWFTKESEGRTAEDVLNETRSQFARMRVAVEQLPAEALDQSPPWLDGYPLWAVIDGSLGHFYEEHNLDIERWLQQQGA
ncbi:hypothetical protein BH09CHL1_BH09CHL1_36800 [soil metagenome]